MKEVKFARAIWVVSNVFNNFSHPKLYELYCQILVHDSSLASNNSLVSNVEA